MVDSSYYGDVLFEDYVMMSWLCGLNMSSGSILIRARQSGGMAPCVPARARELAAWCRGPRASRCGTVRKQVMCVGATDVCESNRIGGGTRAGTRKIVCMHGRCMHGYGFVFSFARSNLSF
jgi:hypothetical protein